MEAEALKLAGQDVRKLLAAGNGDAALLYLYDAAGLPRGEAQEKLRMTSTRYDLAAATLQQLGLWREETKKFPLPAEAPHYTEGTSRGNTTRGRNFRAWSARRSGGWGVFCPRRS